MKLSRLHFPRNKIALGIKAVTIILATIAIYFQDLAIVANEAIRSELMSHILATPLLLAYLVYRKRKMLRAVIPFETTTRKPTCSQEIIGALLCLTAFLLYWHGSYTFHPLEYHMISLPIFTAGLTTITFNTKTLKVVAFPIAFLLFLTPPPLETIYAAGATLSTISSEAAYNILNAMGLPVNLADQYGTPVIILQKPEGPLSFAIDIACAGVYSLIGFTIFTVFATYILRGAEWKRATLFLSGFLLIYALNIIRIIIIVLIGNQYGMEPAMQAFHLLGGWVLIFTGTLILLTLSEKIFKIRLFTTKPKTTPCNYCSQNPATKQHFCSACGRLLNPMNIRLSKRDLSKMFVLILSVILIANIQVPVFALVEGRTEIAVQTIGGEQTTTQILPKIQGYTTKFIYRDKKFEEIAKQDAALVYVYLPTDETKTPIWVTLEIAQTRGSLHRWEVCLVTWPQITEGHQPRVTQLSLRDIQLLQNPPITARYFAFQEKKSNLTQVVLYWYENAFFNTGKSLEKEHVKISLIAFAKTPGNVSLIEEELLPLGQAIASYWQPIKTWSQIALLIAQNGNTLIIITTMALLGIVGIQVIKNQKEKGSNLKVYNKLGLEERLIMQAVHQAAQTTKPTGNTVASSYQKLAKKPIQLSLLMEKLSAAEEAGLIKREITSQDDEPVLVWKNQVPF